MLRKKEKKAIASIFALLVGWPVGLDRFLEGKNTLGVLATVGWVLTIFVFVVGAGMSSGGIFPNFFYLAAVAGVVGGVLATVKLVKLLRAFVDADD